MTGTPVLGRQLVVIPTYNERENVSRMCEELVRLGLDADILFIDDGSPDGTGEVLDGLAARHARVRVLHRSGKSGIGSAHQAGIAAAYDEGYQTLVTLDCDFSHAPADIPRMMDVAVREDTEIVVGSRHLAAHSLPGWNPLRRALTFAGHFMTSRLLEMPEDASGAFRLYRLDRIPRELFALVKSPGYAFFFESLYMLSRRGQRVAEMPIVLPARTHGHSKMTWRDAVRSLSTLRELFWKHALYELVANAYRKLVIRPNLRRVIERTFAQGSELLHAGAGSGHVDAPLHRRMRITALDRSQRALQVYRRNNPGVHQTRHGTPLAMPLPDATFDGVYNLGVVEHFAEPDLARFFAECHRVLKPGGRAAIFWPHRRATSGFVIRAAHRLFRGVGPATRMHAPEVSLLQSRAHAEGVLAQAGLRLTDYEFSARDLWVQAVVIAEKPVARHSERSEESASPLQTPRVRSG
jgi:dolichol-phosphate mannosyltransferase